MAALIALGYDQSISRQSHWWRLARAALANALSRAASFRGPRPLRAEYSAGQRGKASIREEGYGEFRKRAHRGHAVQHQELRATNMQTA